MGRVTPVAPSGEAPPRRAPAPLAAAGSDAADQLLPPGRGARPAEAGAVALPSKADAALDGVLAAAGRGARVRRSPGVHEGGR